MDAEAALAAELLDSRRRAEELQALLDAERRRAAEAESQLRERERLLQEAQRKPIDKELAEKQRAVLSQDLLALKQHSQRFSNASGAVEVVIPGLHANAATVQAGITAHFATLHELLHRREDKMHALVEALTSEKLDALQAQKQRMDAVTAGCEKAIKQAEEVLGGDDWTLMTKREHVAAEMGHALSLTCQLEADWSEKLQAHLPATLEEMIESHGVVSYVPFDEPVNQWHKDLAVVSRVAEPPRLLAAARPSQGNSDYGFMFDVKTKKHSICVRALHLSSGTGGGPWQYKVFTAPGCWKPISGKRSKWTQVGKEVVALPPPGDGQTGRVKLVEDGVHIAAGSSQCFYIHSAAHMTAVTFTAKPIDTSNGRTLREAAVIDEDAYLSIHTGAKSCSEVPFSSVSADQIRAFSGCVEYVLWCES